MFDIVGLYGRSAADDGVSIGYIADDGIDCSSDQMQQQTQER